jgi:hypothetical protein
MNEDNENAIWIYLVVLAFSNEHVEISLELFRELIGAGRRPVASVAQSFRATPRGVALLGCWFAAACCCTHCTFELLLRMANPSL